MTPNSSSKSPFLTVRALLVAMFAGLALFAAAGTSQAAVGPPATECQLAFGSGYIGFKIDNVEGGLANGTYTDGDTGFKVKISNSNTTLQTFDYKASWPVNVIVKGGTGPGNFYSPESLTGEGLHAPERGTSGKFFDISHITFCWKPTPPQLKIKKIADNPVVYGGDQVIFTITVKNYGTQASKDVVITDDVPAGLTVNSADPPCTVNVQVVTCSIGTLPGGESRTYKIYATADPLPPVPGTGDSLGISKVEEQLSLSAGETRTVLLTCGPTGIMTDASVRVDHVDQGTGDLNSVEVRKIQSVNDSTYEAVVKNHATGQAQAKFFGVCVEKQTNGGRTITVGPLVSKTQAVDEGLHTLDLTCPAGTTPVAPGYELTDTRGILLASAPVGSDTRKFTFRIESDGASVTVSMRCLDNETSAINGITSTLQFDSVHKTVEIGPGAIVIEQLSCGIGYKGIVAGWEYPDGVVPLGNEPVPIARFFKIWNTTDKTQTVKLYLLCLKLNTDEAQPGPKEFTNTAFVTSSTPQAPGAILSDSATVTVLPGTNPGPVILSAKVKGGSVVLKINTNGKAGNIVVRSSHRVSTRGAAIRRGGVIGKRGYGAGASGTIRVKLNRKAVRAIRKGGLKRVRVTVNAAGKVRNRVVGINR